MKVIGLGNKARHGKNYLAERMAIEAAAKYNTLATLYGFGDALKATARVMFGMRKKDAPLLQTLGTNVYRHVNPDIWVEVLKATIEEQQPKLAIIYDVRFPNEAQAIKDMGGILVRVSRFNQDGSPFVAPDRPADHPSEIALDDYNRWDFEVKATSGQLDYLNTVAKNILFTVLR